MKRTRRFPGRLLRWTSLCVCLALVLVSLVPLPLASVEASAPFAQGQKITPPPPQKGAPFPNLPNLDLIKQQLPVQPSAPAAIPSTTRSRYRPLKGRNGLKVGDPGTTNGAIAKDSSPRPSAKTTDSSAVTSSSSSSQSRLHHTSKSAIRNSKSAMLPSPPTVGDDQFIQNFFSYALSRTPTGGEQTYWDDVVRAAYPQGQNAVLFGARELGMTLFESAEYAARNRSDTDYVYDLYWTYLMRYPDQGGWQFWTSQVPSMGRENVRHAFDESTEFINLVATITPNGSASGNQTALSSARVDPNNESGNQLLARDCEWSVPILSLPGRSGLDLGLGLSYSSSVWTRSGPSDHPYLYFDEDRGWPSPGFRLGFPVVQLPYFDAQSGRSIYMFTTSAGQRVELRQVGTSNVYEAADSSYLQLTDNGSTLLLRATDGTQLNYQRFENEWHVTQLKDRNGNYLSVNYNAQGTSGQYDIHSITDTLNRTINFIYDGYNNLTSITQTWGGTTHTWATFSWGSNLTMDTTSFTGINVVGTHNGESIPVLRQVSLDDGSYYTFDYSGVGQVTTIHRYTSDNVQRAYTAYNYDGSTSDCPRITASRVWADAWTGINGLPSEVTTQFAVDGDGGHRMTLPDSTVYKEYYGSSTSWQRGLTTMTKSYASVGEANSDSWKKETTASWDQDSTSVSYQTNPRVTQTDVYDGTNHRKTTISYTTFALPSDVYEYDFAPHPH